MADDLRGVAKRVLLAAIDEIERSSEAVDESAECRFKVSLEVGVQLVAGALAMMAEREPRAELLRELAGHAWMCADDMRAALDTKAAMKRMMQ